MPSQINNQWAVNNSGRIVPNYSNQSTKQIVDGWMAQQMNSLRDNSHQLPNFQELFARLDTKGGGGGGGTDGKGGKNKNLPPGDAKWTYKPNPLDLSHYLPNPDGSQGVPSAGGIGNAAQYTIVPPSQPWMLNPAGSNPAPQGYGYYQQWAMNPNAGY